MTTVPRTDPPAAPGPGPTSSMHADSFGAGTERLLSLVRQLTTSLDPVHVAERIVWSAATLFAGRYGALWTVLDDGSFRLDAYHVVDGSAAPAYLHEGCLMPPGTGIMGMAAKTGTLAWTRDVLADARVQLPADFRSEIDRHDVRTIVAAPLRMRGRVIGVLVITGPLETRFDESDGALLQAFADQAALAIDNATLYESCERRRRTAEALVQLEVDIARAGNLSQRLDVIIEHACRLLQVRLAGLALVDVDKGEMVADIVVRRGLTDRFPMRIVPREWGVGPMTMAIRERMPFVSTDIGNDGTFALSAHALDTLRAEECRSMLAAPICQNDEVLGALVVFHEAPAFFTPDDVALLSSLANHAAHAIESTRLLEEAQQQRKSAEILAELARGIMATLDTEALLRRITEGAKELTRADGAVIALPDGATGAFLPRFFVGVPEEALRGLRLLPGVGLGGRALVEGRPARTTNYMADEGLVQAHGPRARQLGVKAMMVMPVRIGEESVGLIYVMNTSDVLLTDRDEEALQRLADHAAVAMRNAQLFEEARDARAQARAVSGRLLDAQEVERRRIARDLHDDVGSALAVIKITLQLLRRRANVGSAVEELEEGLGLVERTLQGVRRASLNLRPSILDDLGLVPALRWCLENLAEPAGLVFDVVTDGQDVDVPDTLASACYRIAQEAVTNVVRHAAATRVVVTLRHEPGVLELIVRDDGRGFRVGEAKRQAMTGRSLGILSIEERAALAGGRAEIVSETGRGTEVRTTFPLPAAPVGERGAAS